MCIMSRHSERIPYTETSYQRDFLFSDLNYTVLGYLHTPRVGFREEFRTVNKPRDVCTFSTKIPR